MDKIAEKVFRFYKPNERKLIKHGFIEKGGSYEYSTEIMDGQFSLFIGITEGDVYTEVVDLVTREPYTLFLIDGASGSFVGEVKAAYENILTDIAEKCFDKCIFKSEYTQKIIEYAAKTYGDEPEFLWGKYADCAVFRRKDNSKWYGLIMTVAKCKLGLDSDDKVEILDIKAEPNNIAAMVDGKKIFSGYHMNKKHWITVCFDGSVPLGDIREMLDISYRLAGKR